VLDTEKDRIDDRILKGVLEHGKKCESIEEDLYNDQEHHPDRILEPGETAADKIVTEIDAIQFESENAAEEKDQDPKQGTFLEAVLKFTEIFMIDHRVLTGDYLQADAVKSAQRRADGYDRNACEKEKKIYPEYIKKIRQEPHRRVIRIKSRFVHYVHLKTENIISGTFE